MSSGGGGGGTNTVQQNIPDWMRSYIDANYNKAQQVASNPYTPYQGEGVAPMNGMQNAGVGALFNAGASNTGAAAINQGVSNATKAGGYTPQNVSYSAPTTDQIQAQLSPYLKQVMDTTNQQIQQQGAITNQQTNAGATAAGAFGGSRQAVQNALNDKYTQQNIASADANIQNQGYQQAVAQANQNAQGNYNASLANQNAGLQGNAQQLQSAQLLGSLGQAQQGNAAANAGSMITAGGLTQQQQQNVDNYNQQIYAQQQGAGERQLQDLLSATYGGNAGGSSISTTSGSSLGSILGLIGGLGSSAMSFFSDRNLKTDVKDIDSDEAVEKFKNMPISTWRYKPGIGMGDAMHMGPMAQDFQKSFGLGDGHTIQAVDAFGTQAAAIKGLANKVSALEKRGK
ncbi:tail fiber domain-containing protein [Paraburkholderia caribensis]|uniref:tail fiber domain-containing protein n=1 Tax=Paraburkholderia caribensis TaxID=75105 RepID=UPI0020904E12|nr:tail fiber domain-containing protein [Paraburkholderia caribensis]MCO4879061.1 tail fiber domain-containing protein [Paraburkholderia caribensis]